MFKANNQAKDGKMTFPDYIRMVISKNTNFDLSDNTLNHIERIYISPREKNDSVTEGKTEMITKRSPQRKKSPPKSKFSVSRTNKSKSPRFSDYSKLHSTDFNLMEGLKESTP